MDNPYDDPEFRDFANRVQRELVPQIENTDMVISIVPVSKEKVDVKFAVELGLAIMYDKPILACIPPGTPIPEKLSRVVDKFVELDLKDPNQAARLKNSIEEMLAEKEEE